MWAIRVLNGPQAGDIFPLKEGKIRIGRAPGVDLQLNANGISKEHLEITVIGEKLLFTDLNSSNGTFLNGTKVKGGALKLGDKLGLHNTIVDIVVMNEIPVARGSQQKKLMQPSSSKYFPEKEGSAVPAVISRSPAIHQHVSQVPVPQESYFGNGQYPIMSDQDGGLPPATAVPKNFSEKFSDSIEEKIMPGFYQLTEQFDFRIVLMGFVGAYVIMITLMTMLPMKQITADSISIESRRRAVTVARSLARGNEKVIRSGDMANFSVDYAIREDGVDDVYVISKEGRILAPGDRAGSAPKELGFFKNTVLKAGAHESSSEFGDGKVGAAVPILGYDPELQQNIAKAYGIVIYNQGSLQMDDGRVLSLFIQMLALALVSGGVLFFFLYKMVEYPYQQLNKELESALRDKRESTQIKVKIPVLQSMLTNLNSLLARAATSTFGQTRGDLGAGSKNDEYFNLLQLIGFPALLIDAKGVILKGNAAFPATTGISLMNIENQKLSAIPDQAMQKNFTELMQIASAMTSQLAKDSLEISGTKFATSCQAATTATGEVDCYFITISPMESIEGQAA